MIQLKSDGFWNLIPMVLYEVVPKSRYVLISVNDPAPSPHNLIVTGHGLEATMLLVIIIPPMHSYSLEWILISALPLIGAFVANQIEESTADTS